MDSSFFSFRKIADEPPRVYGLDRGRQRNHRSNSLQVLALRAAPLKRQAMRTVVCLLRRQTKRRLDVVGVSLRSHSFHALGASVEGIFLCAPLSNCPPFLFVFSTAEATRDALGHDIAPGGRGTHWAQAAAVWRRHNQFERLEFTRSGRKLALAFPAYLGFSFVRGRYLY